MDEQAYRRKQNERRSELLLKDEWSDADKLEYMLCDIRPYSIYWRWGMVKALKRAIKLLREKDGE